MADEEIKEIIENSDEAENTLPEGQQKGKRKNGYVVRFARLLILGGIALVFFVVFFIWFWHSENKETTDYCPKIVVMGDSIFAHTIDETSVVNLLSDKMDMEIADISFGGSCMSYIDRDARMGNNHDAFSMAALTQAILAKDFRYQESANVRLYATEYFDDRIELLKSIDFSQVDILIINHLLNDYQIVVPPECGSDKYDEYTYEGAIRSVITQLKKAYPNMRIIIVAPVKSWYTEEYIVSKDYDSGYGTVDKYIEVQRDVSEELGVEWISLFDLYDDHQLTLDSIHPNEEAREMIADYLYDYLADGE